MKSLQLSEQFFSRLETLALILKSNLSGYFGGKHFVKTYGQTMEFADYREYQLGDDIRRIDWNLYSRFEKHFLKLFTDERQMQIQIFLDCSASMGQDNPQKAFYAIKAAAALGFLSVHNMDKVSFHLMRENRAENPFGTIVGKNAFYRAIKEMESIEFKGDVDIGNCVTSCPNVNTGKGLTIIISDFFTEDSWKRAVDYLGYKRRQVMLFQVLSQDEADPLYDGRVSLIDSESVDVSDSRNMKLRISRNLQKAYAEAMKDFKKGISTFCSKRDVDFISACSDSQIEKVLFGELLKVGAIK